MLSLDAVGGRLGGLSRERVRQIEQSAMKKLGLEGSLENALRNPQTRIASLKAIATRIVDALAAGLGTTSLPISPPPDVARSDR